MQPNVLANQYQSLRKDAKRVWQWLILIHSKDPIRQALNQGFASIIIFFMSISIGFVFVTFLSREIGNGIITLVSIPLQMFIWWLNRRGTIHGAAIYVIWLIAVFVLVSPPDSYTGADTPIPILLIFPIIIATLFIRPIAGLWALIVTMVVLGIQLALSDVPREHMMRFLVVGTLDLLAITIFLMIGASIFWRVLGDSITANAALRRQQEQFHYASLATQDAIYERDLGTNVVLCNETYRRLYASDDPTGEDQVWWESRVHPDDNERVKAAMQDLLHRRSDYWSAEYRLRRRDGEYATVIDRAYMFYDSTGQPIRMIGAMADITERKQTEVRMRALIDAIPDMIVRHDRHGRYLEIKAAPSIPLNYAIPDAIGKTVWEMLPHDPQLAEDLLHNIEKVLDTGQMEVQEYKLVVDGKVVYRETRTVPTASHEVIMLIRDITERKQAEAEHLELALARERAELLKEFVNTVSHDLKTPLTIINTNLYLIEKTDDPERQKSRIKTIKEQVEHLSLLIQDILTISRLDTFPDMVLQAIEIDALLSPLQDQFQDVAKQRHLTLKLDLAPNLLSIWGSTPDLQRVFINLVENALHYTLSDGTVTVRTFAVSGQVGIEVEDSGIGIDESDLRHIFEPFYRSPQARSVNSRGTGLGLAIVKKIIDRHHGKIEVKSTIGQGTTFRVLLPTVPESAAPASGETE